MSLFPKDIQFKYSWRTYQKRVLDSLQEHLLDDHLHVIAPPGSGKTVLGLEVMLRIGEPTLILAPTLTIKNQWIQRFCELFIQCEGIPEWISDDIRNPKLVTVSTYQGLHSACNDRNWEGILLDFEDVTDIKERKKSNYKNLNHIVSLFQSIGLKVLVLDEAHHLQREWAQTLNLLKEKLDPKVIGLTATPPYDVSALEWGRYISLTGPVDAEITVPELIQEGDLCPHQDYVYFTENTAAERKIIDAFRMRANAVYKKLIQDESILAAVKNCPIITDPIANDYFIFDNLTLYSACLIFLNFHQIEIPALNYELLGLNIKKEEIKLPLLDERWLEVLLTNLLFEEKAFPTVDEIFKTNLLNELKHQGLIDHKKVRFRSNTKINKYIKSSITKLDAIEDIVEFEYEQLKEDLRQVILTDYVRKEYLIKDSENNLLLKKIGVLPIFEKLRRNNKNGKRIGVLTGSLVILPTTCTSELIQVFSKNDFSLLPYDKDYILMNCSDTNRKYVVQEITKLFQAGSIEVLIGTKALLGEGWDAPSINSLVLATTVGAFVSSNQMRGRAIRSDKNNPDKTSNIWHLATIDNAMQDGGEDWRLLKRRFRNFVGVAIEDIKIENGVNRLGFTTKIDPSYCNQKTLKSAKKRSTLQQQWSQAIENGTTLVEEIQIPYKGEVSFEAKKQAEMKKTIANMVSTLGTSVMLFLEWSTSAVQNLSKVWGFQTGYAFLGVLGVGTVFFLGKTIQTFSYFNRYRDITKDIYAIARALVRTLCKVKIFSARFDSYKVLTFGDKEGNVFCHLEGGTGYERSMFVKMLQEIIDPINYPRYIILRKSKLFKMVSQIDYHSVPEMLGKKKALATRFFQYWKEEVGDSELIFTKSIPGRKILIRSKIAAMANHFSENEELQHVHIWK